MMIYKVERRHTDLRLDKTLIEVFPGATFGLIQKLCRKGQIRLEGKRVKGNERLKAGQEIKLPEFLSSTEHEREYKEGYTYQLSKKDAHDVENMVLFEDENMIVLNKDYGLPVQAGSGHSKSLDRMLKAYVENEYEPKLVHRIDKTTTGLVLFAKNKENARDFAQEFKTRKVEKIYLAVVKGRIKSRELDEVIVIKSEMEKTDDDGYETMAVRHNAQKAETHYKVLESAGVYHLLEVHPKTGRKHQIRVHLESVGLPIVGDIKYGGEKFESDERVLKNKLFLHAYALNISPYKKPFTAEMPEHFKVMCKLMQWDTKL